MEKLDCCGQGQSHSKILKCQYFLSFFFKNDIFYIAFVQIVFSESLNLLLPNLVWWCIIMSQIVFKKNWLAVYKVKVTVKDKIIKTWLFDMLFELLILLQLILVWWYFIIRWIILWKDWIVLLWSRSSSQKRFRVPENVHLDNISTAAEPSVTKLSIVMQYHGPKYYARRLVSRLQVQGHIDGSFGNQI